MSHHFYTTSYFFFEAILVLTYCFAQWGVGWGGCVALYKNKQMGQRLDLLLCLDFSEQKYKHRKENTALCGWMRSKYSFLLYSIWMFCWLFYTLLPLWLKPTFPFLMTSAGCWLAFKYVWPHSQKVGQDINQPQTTRNFPSGIPKITMSYWSKFFMPMVFLPERQKKRNVDIPAVF